MGENRNSTRRLSDHLVAILGLGERVLVFDVKTERSGVRKQLGARTTPTLPDLL